MLKGLLSWKQLHAHTLYFKLFYYLFLGRFFGKGTWLRDNINKIFLEIVNTIKIILKISVILMILLEYFLKLSIYIVAVALIAQMSI